MSRAIVFVRYAVESSVEHVWNRRSHPWKASDRREKKRSVFRFEVAGEVVSESRFDIFIGRFQVARRERFLVIGILTRAVIEYLHILLKGTECIVSE